MSRTEQLWPAPTAVKAGSIDDLISDLSGDGDVPNVSSGRMRIDGTSYRLIAFCSGALTEWLKIEVVRSARLYETLAQALADRGRVDAFINSAEGCS